jgi:hypothetical protein
MRVDRGEVVFLSHISTIILTTLHKLSAYTTIICDDVDYQSVQGTFAKFSVSQLITRFYSTNSEKNIYQFKGPRKAKKYRETSGNNKKHQETPRNL